MSFLILPKAKRIRSSESSALIKVVDDAGAEAENGVWGWDIGNWKR